MKTWHAVAAVTRWEFNRYIKWKQQFVGMLITIAIFGGFTILPRLGDDDEEDARTIAVIGADVLPLDVASAGPFAFTRHDATEEGALRAHVEDGALDGLLIVRDTDNAQLVLRRRADWSAGLQDLLTSARRQHMIAQSGLSQATLADIMAPPEIDIEYAGTAAGQNRGERITIIIVLSLMLMTVFIGMSYIFASVTGEKQIRVTEQVISAIRPQAWIDGKILGLLLVSLIGMFVQVLGFGAVFLALRTFFDAAPLPLPDTLGDPLTVTLIVLFAMLGLFFWFAFLGAVAATIDDPNHSARSSLMLVPILTTVLAYFVVPNPDSGMSRFLSLFPPSAPGAMPARLLTSDVGALEIVISLALLAATTLLLRTAAGRIFEIAMLMYGKEPSWAEMRRWTFGR